MSASFLPNLFLTPRARHEEAAPPPEEESPEAFVDMLMEDWKEPPPPPLATLATGGDVVEEEEVQYGPFQEDVVNETAMENKPFCFLCEISPFSEIYADNPHINMMHRVFNRNYLTADPATLARKIQKIFNVNIRPYVKQPHLNQDWLLATIWLHWEEHCPTNLVRHCASIRAYDGIIRVLRKRICVYRKHPLTRKMEAMDIDDSKVLTLMKVTKERSRIMKEIDKNYIQTT